MSILQIGRTISLPCGMNDIKSVAINHCDFCFLDCSGCRLIKWSPNEQKIVTIALGRKYLCICYDHRENCYWAIPECEPHLICRLDACFCELGHIVIKGAWQQRPVSLCCDICENGLWICYPCQLAHVEKCSEKTTWDKSEDSQKINLGITVQCGCRAMCYYECGRQILEVTSLCDAESIELCIQKEYRIIGMAPCCCEYGCKKCCFCILFSKICSPDLILVEYCVDFSNRIVEPCCPRPCPPVPDPCPPHPCPPHCGGSYEIMHSIALEEAGISHILNAEGEKIQKAVAISDNIKDLICVNESVKRTLTQVTLLEGMLYSKLEALVNCDDFCHPKKPDSPCPCPHHLLCCDECHDNDLCK